MDPIAQAYDQWIERFIAWAQARPDVYAAVVVGSRARMDRPADPWSDLDLILIVDQPRRYLSGADWLTCMGHPWISFLEGTADGEHMERRVLFEGGLDVDFVLLAKRDIQLLIRLLRLHKRLGRLRRLLPGAWRERAMHAATGTADLIRRGARVLLDKWGLAAYLHLALDAAGQPARPPPTEEAFLNLNHDFWYHTVWTAKKLRRGELWTAQGCSDRYMKGRLLQMIEWHAGAAHGWDYDTWHGGRFLEQWADPRIVTDLKAAFAHYDAGDLWRGLRATMDLFRWIAVETAARGGYPYPTAADERATALVQHLATGSQASSHKEDQPWPDNNIL